LKFVVSKRRQYWWPIKVRLPAADERRAGNVEEFTFKALFEAIDTKEAKAIRDEVNALPADERHDRQNDLLLRAVVGWNEDIIDDEKQPVPFDIETLKELLTDQWVSLAFWRAWGESMSGDSARKGN
jgi:hypothetical protein